MKKLIIIVVVILLIFTSFSFTNYSKKPTAEGYYISNNGDTNRVAFFIKTNLLSNEIDLVNMQSKIKFISKTGEKGKINPEEVKEYSFNYLNKEYRYQSALMSWNPILQNKIFIKLEIEGKCKLYTFYQYDQYSHLLHDNPVLHLDGRDPYFVSDGISGSSVSILFNHESLSNYFSACPELEQKIKEKEFKTTNTIEITNFYNAHCKK